MALEVKLEGQVRRRSIEECVERLRDAIINGVYMPNERLIEVDLAQTLNTNRANIRTVLAVLEKEELVTREPNRGARVRRISDREALEIAEARQALEVLVTRQATERATPSDHEELKSILIVMDRSFKSDDLKDFSLQNSLLHEKIRQIARNETVSKLLQGLRFHFVRLQYQTLFKPGRMDRSMKEHREIVTAICSGSADRAGEAMWRHLESIKDSIRWYSERSMGDAHPETLRAARRP